MASTMIHQLQDIGFCQASEDGKLQLPEKREPLELSICSDVYHKIQTPSLGRSCYYLIFIDNSTQYVGIATHLEK